MCVFFSFQRKALTTSGVISLQMFRIYEINWNVFNKLEMTYGDNCNCLPIMCKHGQMCEMWIMVIEDNINI